MYLSRRLFQAVTAAQRKSRILELRKTSGYSLGQSKKALDANDYDVAASVKWLGKQARKEGWTKMKALSGRKAVEGYVAVAQTTDRLALYEINCETDFVAKTDGFRGLVQSIGKQILSSDQVDQKTCDELIAKEVFGLRENLRLARSKTYIKAEGVHYGVYVHNPTDFEDGIQGGRFGVVVKGTLSENSNPETLNLVAQHIMAANPKKIGKWNESEFDRLKCADDITDEERKAKTFQKINAEEARLLYQEHMMLSEYCVGKFLKDDGARVTDFARFQLGETAKAE